MLRTYLTGTLAFRYPLVGAPMAGVAGGDLARVVSEAGGLGMIGVGSRDSPEFVDREVAVARAQDPGLRLGVGLMAWDLQQRPEMLEAVTGMRPYLVSVSFGSPQLYVEALHRAGALVATQVHTRAEAVLADRAGVDLVVAQGHEAGGHTGSVGSLPLLQIVLDATSRPVLAAGGIASPAGVAACLAAGAQGVWVGTAFTVCPESRNPPQAVERILAAAESETVRTHLFDRAQGVPWPEEFPGRALRNRFTDRWHGREAEMLEDPSAAEEFRRARQEGDYTVAHVYAGQAVGLLDSARPAGEVVRRLMEGAEALLRERLAGLVG
ncbi:MAG: NAD(P)H-dependent flavin oxidoreductase [Candidatus Dormibacterales bacterium]